MCVRWVSLLLSHLITTPDTLVKRQKCQTSVNLCLFVKRPITVRGKTKKQRQKGQSRQTCKAAGSLLELLHEAVDIEDVFYGHQHGRPSYELRREHAAAAPLAPGTVLDCVGRPQHEGAHRLGEKKKEGKEKSGELGGHVRVWANRVLFFHAAGSLVEERLNERDINNMTHRGVRKTPKLVKKTR